MSDLRVHEFRVGQDVIDHLETGEPWSFTAPKGEYRVGDFAVLINSAWANPSAPSDIETVRIGDVYGCFNGNAVLVVSRCSAAQDLEVIRVWRAGETVRA